MSIHEYDKEYLRAQEQVKESTLSEKNKQLIFSFVNDLLLEGLSKPRLIKYYRLLRLIALGLGKDLDTVTLEELKQYIGSIQQESNYSPWTKKSYKNITRRFYRWMTKTKGYPNIVDWISLHIGRSQKKLPSQSELLTEEDVHKLIQIADHPRDKAFVFMLWESGARVGELGNLTLENIGFDQHGMVLAMQGKTGSRKIRLVASTAYASAWVKNHPLKNDTKAPLWINIGSVRHYKAMRYDNMRMLLKRLFERAGIKKRFNPHLFRHSRATFMAHHLTEFQMNHYFGWIQGSDMPSTYVHMSGRDVDKAILAMNGILPQEKKQEKHIVPRVCPRCDTINSYDSLSCTKCNAILDMVYAMEIQQKQESITRVREQSDTLMTELLKDPDIQRVILQKMSQRVVITHEKEYGV